MSFAAAVSRTTTPSAAPAASQRRVRFDLAGRLGKLERTAGGGVRVPAFISRVGVLVYRDADGSERRELRPASEVLAEGSYSSFEGASVTVKHPADLVDEKIYRSVTVGHVRNVRPDGNRLAADLMIGDGETIAQIESGELVEVSAGYTANVVDSPGEQDGERFDAIQQSIRGNHVALGPEGWGRAGPSVRLRIDAAHEVVRSGPAPVERKDSMTTRMVKIDGLELEAGSAAHLQAVDKLTTRLTRERDAATKRADAAEEQIATLTKERDDAKTRADEASSEANLDSLVKRKLAVVDQARAVLGPKYKWAGRTNRQIMTDALKKAGHAVTDDASDDAIGGAFGFLASQVAKAGKPTADAGDDGPPDDDDNDDAADERGDGGFGLSTAPYQHRADSGPAKPAMPRLDDKWKR